MEKLMKFKQEFEEILKKYDLNSEEKANEIADFLIERPRQISIDEFRHKFPMSEEEAKKVLAYIQMLVEFKNKYS